MSRYIDAKVMEQRVREAMVNSPHMIPPLIKFVRSIPTADVAKVVRLKDGLDDCRIVSDGEYCGYDCGDVVRLIEKLQNKMVEMSPTADVAEVLRCKECKFFCWGNRRYCEEFGGIVTEDDFCSRGERKTNKS